MIERRESLPPQERTRRFFAKNYGDLSESLRWRTIALFGTDKKIHLDIIESWSLQSNMKAHKNFRQLAPGDWEASRIPVRRIRQSLIIAKDGDEIGACVRVVRASYFDRTLDRFVPMPREGDIANYFGLNDNEVAKLMYLDDSDSLYLVREEQTISISPEEANR